MKSLVAGILLIILLGLGVYFFEAVKKGINTSPEPVACTADALLCDDGSAVGRVPPTCEFAQCPQHPSL